MECSLCIVIPRVLLPDNICTKLTVDKGSGACGYNSVCSIETNQNQNQRPSCKCPRGYSLIDPSDQYGSCQPDYVQTCGKPANGSSEELFSLIEIIDTVWPRSDLEQINPSNKDDCRTACLNDCLCAVAIFRSKEFSCWKKKLPLSNGRLDRSSGATAFLKVGKGDAPPFSPDPRQIFPERKKDQGNLILVVSLLLGSSVFVIVLLLFGFFFIYKKKIKEFALINPSVPSNLQYFSYQCLAEATNQFEEEIGRDCFHEKRLELLVEDDAEALCDMQKLKRFVMTAVWCIQEDASLRPTMKRVSQMLEGSVEVLVPPAPYPLTSITT
nr:G-type lectin S-receptor-like serine/threonine-protein kinase RLK1 [Ipomoea batatas]